MSLFTDTRLNGPPRSAFNIGMIEGGASINSIPTLAKAKIDIRSESNEKMDRCWSICSKPRSSGRRSIENERATGGKVASKLKEIGSRPAGRLPRARPSCRICGRSTPTWEFALTSIALLPTPIFPLSLDIPAVSIGAGGQGGKAHTPNEWFLPEGRDLALKRILLTLSLLLRNPS